MKCCSLASCSSLKTYLLCYDRAAYTVKYIVYTATLGHRIVGSCEAKTLFPFRIIDTVCFDLF